MDNTGTASPLEIVTLAMNLAGILILLRLLYTTYLQYVSSIRRFIGVRLELQVLAANRNFRCETVRVLTHMFFITIDVWLMFLPEYESGLYLTLVIGMAIASLCISLVSYLDLKSEKRMTELLR